MERQFEGFVGISQKMRYVLICYRKLDRQVVVTVKLTAKLILFQNTFQSYGFPEMRAD